MSEWETQARESYDRVAQPYAQATRGAAEGNPYMAGTYGTLAALARKVPGQVSVADVGCGPGWWADHLTGQNVRTVGIDVSPAMIALARSNAPHATFQVGSILDLSLPSQSMAGVACMYVLHHVPDDCLDRALDELVRVLAPDGVLLLGGHLGDNQTIKTSGYGVHPMHVQVNRRPAGTGEDRVRCAGLTIEAHTIYGQDDASPSHALFARNAASPAR